MTHNNPPLPEAAEPLKETAAQPAPESPAAQPDDVAQWKDKAYRAAAELDNFRKRSAQEVENARLYASQNFARDMLAMADNLTRALDVPETGYNKALLEGVKMVAAQLEQTFKRHGIQQIAVKAGDALNPDLHQVMTEVASDMAPGCIVQQLQPGYTLNGRLLRPAFVSVASKQLS